MGGAGGLRVCTNNALNRPPHPACRLATLSPFAPRPAALAYAIAALSPTMDVANAALPTYVGSLAFVSGSLIRFDDLPAAWRVRFPCVRAGAGAHGCMGMCQRRQAWWTVGMRP